MLGSFRHPLTVDVICSELPATFTEPQVLVKSVRRGMSCSEMASSIVDRPCENSEPPELRNLLRLVPAKQQDKIFVETC